MNQHERTTQSGGFWERSLSHTQPTMLTSSRAFHLFVRSSQTEHGSNHIKLVDGVKWFQESMASRPSRPVLGRSGPPYQTPRPGVRAAAPRDTDHSLRWRVGARYACSCLPAWNQHLARLGCTTWSRVGVGGTFKMLGSNRCQAWRSNSTSNSF